MSETERLRFQDFAFDRLASGRCRAKVVLSWSDGRQFTGEANVLSTAVTTPDARAASAAASRSTRRIVGFVGDSR